MSFGSEVSATVKCFLFSVADPIQYISTGPRQFRLEDVTVSGMVFSKERVLNFEVLIVGAGPAGISTWLHLQKYAPELAMRTLVIDKANFPRDKICAGGIGGWSADVFDHLEIQLDIPALSVSDVEFRFGNETFNLHKPNFFRIVQRIEFDYALVNIAVKRGLTFHENEAFIDVTREKDRLLIITTKRKYKVSILIAADGAFSIVRRKTMPAAKPRLAPTIEVFVKAEAKYDHEFSEKKMVVDLGPVREGLQGYIWHIPCLRDSLPSMIHGICDFRLHRDKWRAAMKQIFIRELQTRNIPPDPKTWLSYPIPYFSNDAWESQPNVLLVGDAAGIEPAFGGGIHIALSYGEVAARSVVDAFQRHDFSFVGYKKRLQNHLVGDWIKECTRLALEMYGGARDPLEVARILFSSKRLPPDLLSQMLSDVRQKLQNI